VDVGLWTASNQDQDGGAEGEPLVERVIETPENGNGATNYADGGGGGGRNEEAGEGGGVVPWSAEALRAAAALGKERARRAANYRKREPQGEVGAPAPFGRSEEARNE